MHGFIAAVAHPDSHQKIGGIANRPVIVEVGGRPGFDRGGTIQFQGTVRTESNGAGGVVAEDIADEPGDARVKDLERWISRLCVEQVSIRVVNIQNGSVAGVIALVCKRRIGC